MKTKETSLLTVAIVFSLGLAACGGGSGDPSRNTGVASGPVSGDTPDAVPDGGREVDQSSADDAVPDAITLETVPIAEDGSPIESTSGVSVRLDTDTTLYVVSENPEGDDTFGVMSEPLFTDGDMSEAIGGAFLRFDGVEAGDAQVVVRTREPLLAVIACGDTSRDCELVPHRPLDAESVAFEVDADLHYALQRASR